MDPDADGRGVRWRRGYLADCHRLLAFTTASGLMVLPVNYVLVAGTIPP